jgi:ribosomal protein S24E
MKKKPLTSTEKSVLFREKNKFLGRHEMRSIIATNDEQLILKKMCRDKLKELRKVE